MWLVRVSEVKNVFVADENWLQQACVGKMQQKYQRPSVGVQHATRKRTAISPGTTVPFDFGGFDAKSKVTIPIAGSVVKTVLPSPSSFGLVMEKGRAPPFGVNFSATSERVWLAEMFKRPR